MSRSLTHWWNLARFFLAVVGISLSIAMTWLAYTRAMSLVHPARFPINETPAKVGLQAWQDVSFTTSDGLKIHGWFIAPSSPGNGATVILVHGLGNTRMDMLAQAAMLAKHGYATLLFDFRNHGASDGTITTLGFFEIEDIRAALDYLSTRQDIDTQRIGLVGHSMGASTAVRATARLPQIRAVISESAYTSIEDNIAEGVQGLTGLPAFPFAPLIIFFGERETGVDIHRVRPIDDIASISPRPVLLIHGEIDSLISMRNAIQLFDAAREPKQLYSIPTAGHGDLMNANPQEFERRVIDFFARCDALAKCATQ
jgi:pimeloyl-ACP methyl ester carboxylesterase